jgi:4-oxalocrotonate tautomerase
MRRGRTSQHKRDLYAQIVSNLSTRLGLRKEDVMIVLFENELIDWSFGDSIVQVAPPEGG